MDGEKSPGIYWDIKELKRGDKIIVENEDGKSLTFTVTNSEIYDRNHAPIQEIFGIFSKKRLNLITCTCHFDREAQNYVECIVVNTELRSVYSEKM
ncbi:class F sortase [Jeotgalibacillus soli]|uniref:Sortase n=1 Tax=Jeotgalibacillus soli TaxID=889306 RepID=A0A0C2VPB2_9BACL|nr:hypothetical protein KP78_21970 [Jeotgalibacillus soli]